MNKKIYSLNLTDKNNMVTDEQPLVTRNASPELQSNIEQLRQGFSSLQKKEYPWIIAKLVLFVLLMVFIYAFTVSLNIEGSIAASYEHNSYIFYIALALIVAEIVILVKSKSVMKQLKESSEFTKIEDIAEQINRMSFEELNIPEDAVSISFLNYRYSFENDKFTLLPKGTKFFDSFDTNAFVKDGVLHLAGVDQLIEIELKDFVSIEKIQEKVYFAMWPYEVSYKEAPYNKYKITKNREDYIVFSPYYIVTYNIYGTLYDLTIPVYEISKFIQLTGIDYADEYTAL